MTHLLNPPFGSKIGFSNSVGTTGFEILSNATVVDPNPGGEQAYITSTSALDSPNSPNDIGIQKVRIVYFDNNWTKQEEYVTMNGTTDVLVEVNMLRVETFEAFQAGAAFFAQGTITLKSTEPTPGDRRLFAQIDSGTTNFPRALHYVSPGKIVNIIDIIANCPTSGGVQFVIFITEDNTVDGGGPVSIPGISFILANDTMQISLNLPIVCNAIGSTQGLQIGIVVKGLAASQKAIASFSFTES